MAQPSVPPAKAPWSNLDAATSPSAPPQTPGIMEQESPSDVAMAIRRRHARKNRGSVAGRAMGKRLGRGKLLWLKNNWLLVALILLALLGFIIMTALLSNPCQDTVKAVSLINYDEIHVFNNTYTSAGTCTVAGVLPSCDEGDGGGVRLNEPSTESYTCGEPVFHSENCVTVEVRFGFIWFVLDTLPR